MVEISFFQMILGITFAWIIVRSIAIYRNRGVMVKRELQLLLVYVCIVVIARLVYFGYHLVDGKIDTLKLGFTDKVSDMVSIIPFNFLFDRYDGWQRNILGNIAMFIPVGIVWPVCFRQLDSMKKVVLAGAGLTALIELSQLICLERHTDIDDIILNTTGVLIGAAIVFLVRMIRRNMQAQ